MNNLIKCFFLLFVVASASLNAQEFASESDLLYGINSPFGEEYVTLHPDGNKMAFTRGNHPYNQGGKGDSGDIWVSVLDSTWRVATNWHDVNGESFSSPIGWSNDGSTFLFNKISTKGGTLTSEVWAISGRTSTQLNLSFFKNKSTHQSGCLSADNRFLIMSMESGATHGVEDLYLLTREGDSWSAPKNIGPDINSKFQELTPFLSADNRTLYFATNGREGFGSFDIYASERLDDTWTKWSAPRNLGAGVNSAGRETSFSFIPGQEYAYFVSTQNSDGYGDIRRVKFKTDEPAENLIADTTVFVKKTELPSQTGMQLLNAKTSAPVSRQIQITSEQGTQTKSADHQGVIAWNVTLKVSIEVAGYMPLTLQLKSDSLVTGYLEPLEVGRTIRMESVLFYRGSANIIDSSFPELDQIAKMLQKNPNVNILLRGHTDGNGDPNQNLKLSEQRVETVKKYLVGKGVNKKRINGIGIGGEEPIASNETEELRQLNRRVEFEIVK